MVPPVLVVPVVVPVPRIAAAPARMPCVAIIRLSRTASPATTPLSRIATPRSPATTMASFSNVRPITLRTWIAAPVAPVDRIAMLSIATAALDAMMNAVPGAPRSVAGPCPVMRSDFAPVMRTGSASS